MRRGSWLRRFTSLRNTPLVSRRPCPTPEERQARRLVAGRSNGVCECCDQRYATDWSHRKRRSQGGGWCPTNGLHTCRSCHQLIDDPTHPQPRRCGWHVDSHADPAVVPVYLPRHDWVLLATDGGVTPCPSPDDAQGSAT